MAEREHRARKLRLREAEKEVGLILGVICAAQQFVASGDFVEANARVVTGGDLPRADGVGHFQKSVEFYVVVAERARNGRAATEVLGDERLDYLIFELPLEVHNIIR